jgi:hypothetical protein
MTNNIGVEDVQNVANSLGITLTNDTIDWVLKNYDDWENYDTTSNWSEIVESMLYSLK